LAALLLFGCDGGAVGAHTVSGVCELCVVGFPCLRDEHLPLVVGHGAYVLFEGCAKQFGWVVAHADVFLRG
jgi:hypothetical protein